MKRKKRVPKPEVQDKLELSRQEAIATTDFIKAEKNLTSLGFFTPSSKRIKNERVKTITFTRMVDGNRVEAKVTIAPSAMYGLPVTADQDKYLAFQKIVTDIQQQHGRVKNPIGFSSSELLKLLNQGDAGKNYQEVGEWLDVMTSTTIFSEGAVYLAGRKVFAKDRFHIFDRAVSMGKELEPGVMADRNYVWLSEWQLENINNNYLLPIDFETYKRLRNHIAKALVPLLQIWLYASREEGCFEKRYDELCQILAIREYRHLSEIKRNFVPSLDELKQHGYLADWKIEKTTDRKAYKIIFYHGDKFHRDRHRRKGLPVAPAAKLPPASSPAPAATGLSGEQQEIVAALTRRGVLETSARKLLATLAENQPVIEQLEYADQLIAKAGEKSFRNPAGFYLYLVKQNVVVPEWVETTRKRKLRKESQAAETRAQLEHLELQQAYDEYRRREIDRHITEVLGEEAFSQLVATKRREWIAKYPKAQFWESETLTQLATSTARAAVAEQSNIYESFEVFCQQYRQLQV